MFAENGFAAATLDDIAHTVGYTNGNFVAENIERVGGSLTILGVSNNGYTVSIRNRYRVRYGVESAGPDLATTKGYLERFFGEVAPILRAEIPNTLWTPVPEPGDLPITA